MSGFYFCPIYSVQKSISRSFLRSTSASLCWARALSVTTLTRSLCNLRNLYLRSVARLVSSWLGVVSVLIWTLITLWWWADSVEYLVMGCHCRRWCIVIEDHSVTPKCLRPSPEVSRRCTVVPAELVKPSVPRAAWTSPPTWVRNAPKWQIIVTPQGLVEGVSSGSLATCPESEPRRQTIGSSTGPRQLGDRWCAEFLVMRSQCWIFGDMQWVQNVWWWAVSDECSFQEMWFSVDSMKWSCASLLTGSVTVTELHSSTKNCSQSQRSHAVL